VLQLLFVVVVVVRCKARSAGVAKAVDAEEKEVEPIVAALRKTLRVAGLVALVGLVE
jgi:hypothetical protein